MKKIFNLSLVPLIVLMSCGNSSSTSKTRESPTGGTTVINDTIAYHIAKHYFVKNTVPDELMISKNITSQAEFDSLFQAAATMGTDGLPTTIDFSRSYAIAFIVPSTSLATTLSVSSLKKKNNQVILSYNEHTGEKQSFRSRHFLLLIVDKKDMGQLIIKKDA